MKKVCEKIYERKKIRMRRLQFLKGEDYLVLGKQGKVQKDLKGFGIRRHHYELRNPPVQSLCRWPKKGTQRDKYKP